MRRLISGFLIACVVAVGVSAQSGILVSFGVGDAKLSDLKEALETLRTAPGTLGDPAAPPIDNVFMKQWIESVCRGEIEATIHRAGVLEQQTGRFDVTGLTRAQRLQVRALIESFKK